MANTTAYYDVAKIASVKSFIVQAQGMEFTNYLHTSYYDNWGGGALMLQWKVLFKSFIRN